MNDNVEVNPFLDDRVLSVRHNDSTFTAPRNAKGQLLPGAQLNPGKRRKTKPITEALKRLLASKTADDVTLAEAMAREAIKTAQCSGDKNYIGALNIVLDRVEGKVPVNLGIDDETRDFLSGNHIAKLMVEAQQEQKRLTSNGDETPQDEQGGD